MNNFEKEVLELSNELSNLISYGEWGFREYGSVSVDLYDTASNLIKAGYRKRERKFYDIETKEIVTEDDLARELEELKQSGFEHDDITLAQYINNCLTINNGTLEEI